MWKTHDRKAQTVKELRDSMLTKFKKKYIGNWEFYRRYLLLAIPMILQNAITNLVSFLDNIMNFIPVAELFHSLVPISLLLGVGIGFVGSRLTIKKHLKV